MISKQQEPDLENRIKKLENNQKEIIDLLGEIGVCIHWMGSVLGLVRLGPNLRKLCDEIYSTSKILCRKKEDI